MKKYVIILFSFLFVVSSCKTTKLVKIHSHNDYAQQIPFQNAFENGIHSVEVDVFLKNGTLNVTHDELTIRASRNLESMYLKPLSKNLSKKGSGIKNLQLLIDLKSEANTTLNQLLHTLSTYPDLIENDKITFVISGNRPPIEEYINYPSYILFDYQSLDHIEEPETLKKIALISLPFHRYSKWSGELMMNPKDFEALKTVVDNAHGYKKPFRFWGTPDTELAWNTFALLGVDFINTDNPVACKNHFKNKK